MKVSLIRLIKGKGKNRTFFADVEVVIGEHSLIFKGLIIYKNKNKITPMMSCRHTSQGLKYYPVLWKTELEKNEFYEKVREAIKNTPIEILPEIIPQEKN